MKYEVHELPYDVKSLVSLAKGQEWEVERTSSGHYKFISPNGEITGHSGTPSDHRAIRNLRARLKKMGLRPYTPLKEDKPVPEPKLVVSKVEGDSTKPVPPVGAGKNRLPKGGLEAVLLPLIREMDRPDGLSAEMLLPRVQEKIPNATLKTIGVGLANYTARKKIVRVSMGRFRVPEAVARGQEDDDMKVLEEALAVLAKLEKVVKRLGVKQQQLEQAKTLLNSIK